MAPSPVPPRRAPPRSIAGAEGRALTRSFIEGWEPATPRGTDDHVERALAEADPGLGRIIDAVAATGGRLRFRPSTAASHFDAIARSIVYQQLSKPAGASIYARLCLALEGSPDPARVLAATDYGLRRTGLSASKIRYLKALASALTAGELDLDELTALPDDAVVQRLTRLPGIGIWTAQMFLMFRLLRPDVLPLHDVGIQNGMQVAHQMKRAPAPRTIERAGRKWAPHRSVACLYLWAATDLAWDSLRRPPSGQ